MQERTDIYQKLFLFSIPGIISAVMVLLLFSEEFFNWPNMEFVDFEGIIVVLPLVILVPLHIIMMFPAFRLTKQIEINSYVIGIRMALLLITFIIFSPFFWNYIPY